MTADESHRIGINCTDPKAWVAGPPTSHSYRGPFLSGRPVLLAKNLDPNGSDLLLKNGGRFMSDVATSEFVLGTSSLELSIVMPCLNEARTLGICIEKAKAFLDRHRINGEIIVADNGSSDGSQEIAASLGAYVLDVPYRGYGNALRAGIAVASGKYVIMGDSDDSYDFTALEPFLRELRSGYDLVLGNRFAGGIKPNAMPPLHRYFGNPLLTQIGRTLYGTPSRDFYCGLRGFRRDAILALGLDSPGMEFALEMVVKAGIQHLRITEVPTTLSPDGRDRPPHLRSWRDGWRSLRFFLLLSPRAVFLYPGFVLFVIGLLTTSVLLFTNIKVGGIVLAQHTLVVASAMITLGFQAMLFWAFSKIIAMQRGLLLSDATFDRLRAYAPLERGLIVGGALLGIGAMAIIWAFYYWSSVSFGVIEREFLLRIVCGSSTALVLGAQIVFGSLFMSLLEYGQGVTRATNPTS
jgi:glycosyltransferase involved in cell wall biosynthesis